MIVRVIAVLLFFSGGVGFIGYLILWLVGVGGLVLLANLNLLGWFRWGVVWPALLIGVGLLVLLLARKN